MYIGRIYILYLKSRCPFKHVKIELKKPFQYDFISSKKAVPLICRMYCISPLRRLIGTCDGDVMLLRSSHTYDLIIYLPFPLHPVSNLLKCNLTEVYFSFIFVHLYFRSRRFLPEKFHYFYVTQFMSTKNV